MVCFGIGMLYDFIIVGGGISGLYAAYELKKKEDIGF